MSSQGPAGRVLVVVPTTGAALIIRKLTQRPGLPHSAAFAEGDYRPLDLSPDYRALSGPEGPVARHLGRAPPPHELRLSGAPDSGRSWEAPVALAHILLARGWALTDQPDRADLVLWATGAVDLDLKLIPGDYALARKAKMSADLLSGKRAIVVLPPDPDAAKVGDAFAGDAVRIIQADDLNVALQAITDGYGVVAEAAPPKKRSQPIAIVAGLLVIAAVGLGIWALSPQAEVGGDADTAITTAAAETDTAPSTDDPPDASSSPPQPDITSDPTVQDDQDTEPAPNPPDLEPAPPRITLAEIHAAPGASCRVALFDAGKRSLTPVMAEDGGFAPSTMAPSFCGIALAPADPDQSIGAIVTDPADAFMAVPGADNIYFLKGSAPQNLVYDIPVTGKDGAVTLRHKLIQPQPQITE